MSANYTISNEPDQIVICIPHQFVDPQAIALLSKFAIVDAVEGKNITL